MEISYGSERRKEVKFSTSKQIGNYSSRLFLNSVYSDGYRDNNNYIQRNLAGEVKRSGNQGNIFIINLLSTLSTYSIFIYINIILLNYLF